MIALGVVLIGALVVHSIRGRHVGQHGWPSGLSEFVRGPNDPEKPEVGR